MQQFQVGSDCFQPFLAVFDRSGLFLAIKLGQNLGVAFGPDPKNLQQSNIATSETPHQNPKMLPLVTTKGNIFGENVALISLASFEGDIFVLKSRYALELLVAFSYLSPLPNIQDNIFGKNYLNYYVILRVHTTCGNATLWHVCTNIFSYLCIYYAQL